MPVYVHNNTIGPPMNIAAILAGAAAGGALPMLPGGGATTNLGVNGTAAENIGVAAHKTIALGLITCASVIYASTDPGAAPLAWVHHANAGHVAAGDVTAARAGLGNPPWASIIVVFAHPGPQDPGYTASIVTITGQGVLAANIVEVPNLIVAAFGINNLGQVG